MAFRARLLTANFSMFMAALVMLPLSAWAVADRVTAPLIDGMTIELGNYVQRIEVRVRSMGPGKCAVEVSAGGETIGILAPLTEMSAWTQVGPAYLSPSAVSVGFRTVCDTGAVGEIRYFPK